MNIETPPYAKQKTIVSSSSDLLHFRNNVNCATISSSTQFLLLLLLQRTTEWDDKEMN